MVTKIHRDLIMKNRNILQWYVYNFSVLDEKPYWWDIAAQFEEVVGLAANATTALAKGGPTWIATTVSSGEDPVLKFTKGKVSQVNTYICHEERGNGFAKCFYKHILKNNHFQ